MEESTKNVIKVFKRIDKIYTSLASGLSKHDKSELKKAKKNINRLSNDIDELRENVFYFIKNLEESSLSASNFYIVILSLINDLADDLEYIVKKSYKHINNDHSKLKLSQVRDLQEIHEISKSTFQNAMETFQNNSTVELTSILNRKDEVMNVLDQKINAQIERTRNEETSPKNTVLYFNILLKTKELYSNKLNIIKLFLDNTRKTES
jgi:Na+/phosphate symporter